MADKIIDIEEHIERRDLDIILEVNKKAIEIQTEVADQNEEIISRLSKMENRQERIEGNQEKITKQNDEISKELFKVQVMFVTGLLALVAQIIQIFLKR
jgi:hypothetical protein